MARKKTMDDDSVNVRSDDFELAEQSQAEVLGSAFRLVIEQQFGHTLAPPPIFTPFGIKHLDAFIGGGLVSSAPVMLSSTPETGKSTLAFMWAAKFLETHQNGCVCYMDIEGAGTSVEGSTYQMSRTETFGLNPKRFYYARLTANLSQVEQIITEMVKIKNAAEAKSQRQFYMAIIWDSIAATSCSKHDSVDKAESLTGAKARELSFLIDKLKPVLAHKKITLLIIDQVRANFKIDAYEQTENTVGMWKNYKSATNAVALQHNVTQWLFLSKKGQISPGKDKIDVDGWMVDVFSEKCSALSM